MGHAALAVENGGDAGRTANKPSLGNGSSTLAAISRTPTSFDVFFVDPVGDLWWAYSRTPGVWNEAAITFGPLGSYQYNPSPYAHVTAVAPTPETLDVFWVGADGAVHEWSVDDPSVFGSTSPTVIPTTLVTPIQITAPGAAQAGAPLAAVAQTPTDIDVFFAAKDSGNASRGALWTSAYNVSPTTNAGSWTTYEVASTAGRVAPAAIVTAAAQSEANLDVFYAGTDGSVVQSAWNLGNPLDGNGHATFYTAELPGTIGTLASGQPLSVVSPAPSERPASTSAIPGSLQVAWVSSPYAQLSSVYVSAEVSGTWGAPSVIATPMKVPSGASPTSPISIVAPTSFELAVLFTQFGGGLYAGTWTFPASASSYVLTAIPPAVTLGASALTMEPEEGTVETGLVTVSIAGGIPGQTVTPVVSGLPAGVTGSFSPASFTMPGVPSRIVLGLSSRIERGPLLTLKRHGVAS